MSLSVLRTEIKSCGRIRILLDCLFDAIADSQIELQSIDLKAMDLSDLREMLKSARECIVDQYEALDESETAVHAELTKTMRSVG